jgi:hypothetical protein
MGTQTKLKMIAAAVLLALAPLAQADDATTPTVDTQVSLLDRTGANRGQAQVAARIAAQFGRVAGSDANALALVNGLRTGGEITLTSTTTAKGPDGKPVTTTSTTTITPPTKPMGWGNVRISLALAQSALQQAGITKPTAEQLQTALMGGTLKAPDGTTTQVQGVLAMRASGMGWGRIAQAQGTKLGPVMASLKHTQHEVAKLPVKADGSKSLASTATARTKPEALPGGRSSKTTLATANGTSTTSHGHGSRGMTTASGATSSSPSSKGLTTASGASAAPASKGIVTAEGATSGTHGSKSHGKGIVTAAGNAGVNTASASGKPGSSAAGLTTASGAAGATSGVTTAQGGSGSGRGDGHGNGKGKGG